MFGIIERMLGSVNLPVPARPRENFGGWWCCPAIPRPCRDPVAIAKGGVTQEGSALGQLVALHRRKPLAHVFLQRFDSIGVGRPFPNIADHIVKPIAVRLIVPGRSGGDEAVFGAVGFGKIALPDVAGLEIGIIGFAFTPGKVHVTQPATGGMFPLGLGGQAATGSFGIGLRIVPRHMDDGMVRIPCSLHGTRPVDVTPVGTIHAAPPFDVLDAQCRAKPFRHLHPEDEGQAEPFGFDEIIGVGKERGELRVRDCGCLDAKGFHAGVPDRVFAVIRGLGAAGADERPAPRNAHDIIWYAFSAGGVGRGKWCVCPWTS